MGRIEYFFFAPEKGARVEGVSTVEAVAERGRNLVTRGIDLNGLVGKRFRAGEYELEGIDMRAANPKDIDSYIDACPENVRRLLEQIRATIRRAAPDADEAIKYGMPTFVLGENLVHFAAHKHHIGFYPTPSGITRFGRQLSNYKSAKGSVQFPLDEPMPLQLIEKIVRFRVNEVKGKIP